MPRDYATQFLNRKRKEQQQRPMDITISIAPSPYERYGVNGMGKYPLESGHYTGNGPNGVPEPHLPTERRVSANGRPYVVDEAEVLVNDAETVQAYGGPEALDRFIQQNRPDGQMNPRMNGTPGVRDGSGPMAGTPECPMGGQMMGGGNPARPMRYYQGGIPNAEQMYPSGAVVRPQGSAPLATGLERPYDRQFNILREVQYGQVPRMTIGGPVNLLGATIDTEDPATQPTVNPQTGGVEYTGELKSVSGPTRNPIPQMETQTFTFPQQETTIGQTNPIPQMETQTFPQTDYRPMSAAEGSEAARLSVLRGQAYADRDAAMSAAMDSSSSDQFTFQGQPAWKEGDPTRPEDTHIVGYTSIGTPVYGYGEPLETKTDIGQPQVAPTQNTPTWIFEDEKSSVPIAQVNTGETYTPPPSPPPQTGATLSPAQRDQMILDQYLTRQAGMQASERAGEAQRLMQQGVGDEAQRGTLAVSDVSRRSALGDTAAQYGIDAATRAEGRAVEQQKFAENKRRWEANFGVTQANQMIIDAGSMSKESWLAKYPDATEADYNTANMGRMMEAAAGYLSNKIMQDPGYDWKQDPSSEAYLRNAWSAQGSPGDFESWADSYVGGLKTSAGTATINALKQEDWYVNAPDLENTDGLDPNALQTADGQYTKKFYDELLFPALSIQTTFPGLTWGLDENGNLFLKDTTTGTDIDVTTGGVTVSPEDEKALAFSDWDNTYDGIDLDKTSFDPFYDDKGRAPQDEDEWYSWSINNRTFDPESPDSVDAADYVLTQSDLGIETSDTAIAQYLRDNNNKLPATSKDYSEWSKTGRIYLNEDGEAIDLGEALTYAKSKGYDDVTYETLSEYLKQNDGKLGDVDDWSEWRSVNKTVNEIQEILTDKGIKEGSLAYDWDSKTGKAELALSDNELVTLLNSGAGKQYFMNVEQMSTDMNPEYAFSQLTGSAIEIGGQNYVVTGHGGSASGFTKWVTLRNPQTSEEFKIDMWPRDINADGPTFGNVKITVNGEPVTNPNAGNLHGFFDQVLNGLYSER